MVSRVACCCSSFVLFFKIVKPFAAGAGALPAVSLALSLLHASELVLVGKDKEKLSRSIQFSSNLSKCAARSGEFWRRERARECVCLCVSVCACSFFFGEKFSFLFPSELRKLRRIRDRELLDWLSFPLFLRVFWL